MLRLRAEDRFALLTPPLSKTHIILCHAERSWKDRRSSQSSRSIPITVPLCESDGNSASCGGSAHFLPSVVLSEAARFRAAVEGRLRSFPLAKIPRPCRARPQL